MIAALLGLLLPIAGVFYALGLFHGARDAHDEQADTPVSFADVLAEGRVNQAATGHDRACRVNGQHYVSVSTLREDSYAARCLCGWRGEPTGCRQCAEVDSRHHEAETSGSTPTHSPTAVQS